MLWVAILFLVIDVVAAGLIIFGLIFRKDWAVILGGILFIAVAVFSHLLF